jgi:hypothetical protein
MTERRKIEDRLRRKEQEIIALEDQIKEARIYISALQDVLKLLPRDSDQEGGGDAILRPGSLVAQARNIIRAKGSAVHVDEILRILGKDVSRENKAALSGSLAAYVRKGEIFTRPAPNTYGLIAQEPIREPLPRLEKPSSTFGEDQEDDPGLPPPGAENH